MAHLSLRPFGPKDSDQVLQWYEKDRRGIELLAGVSLPDKIACILTFNKILQAQLQRAALLRMIDREARPIGLMTITDISPACDEGMPHFYIAPSERRHSIAAAKIAEAFAARLGFRRLVGSVQADNRRALGLAKRMGYLASPRVILLKELDTWVDGKYPLQQELGP